MNYEVFKADGTKVTKGDSIGQKVEGGKEWFFSNCDKPWRIWASTETDGSLHSFAVDSRINLFNLTIR